MEIDDIVKELEKMGGAGVDVEIEHSRADDLLLAALTQLSPEGQRVADAWQGAQNRARFWYA